MPATKHRSLPAAALLSAALVWLVSVTVCSTRLLGEASHEHPVANEHSDHAPGQAAPASADSHGPSDHHGKPDDSSCCCESFNAFQAQAVALTKAPPPSTSLLYTIFLEDLAYESAGTTVTAQTTGPPGRRSLADLIMERCLLNHAPPLLV